METNNNHIRLSKLPLVSIPVITYNSEKYIIQGLESVKNQTYKNIELIISDDCSTDNTVEICSRWIKDNKNCFVRAILITSEINTGVSGNLNRAISQAKGEWIKTLSGDDMFLRDSILNYIDYAQNHSNADIICGKFLIVGDNPSLIKSHIRFYEEFDYPKIKMGFQKQYLENLKALFVPGPGLFYRKSLWEEVGGYDERYQFCEEDPFMLKIYNSNRKVYFLDKEVYVYQVRDNSLGREKENNHVINRNMKCQMQFYRDLKKHEMFKNKLYFHILNTSIKYNMLQAKENNKIIPYMIYKLFYFISPVKCINQLKHLNYLINNYSIIDLIINSSLLGFLRNFFR